MESASRPRTPRRTLQIAVILVVVVMSLSVASYSVWQISRESPNLEVQLCVINFYNATEYPPIKGYVLVQLNLAAINNEDKSTPLDPSDFVVETSDGSARHFAWRVGNCTVISIYGDESNTSNQGRRLLPGGDGNLWIPFEIPLNLTLVSVTWVSSFGEVTSPVNPDINERLLYYEETGHPP